VVTFNITKFGIDMSAITMLTVCNPIEGTLRVAQAADLRNAITTTLDEISRDKQDEDFWDSMSAEDLKLISDDGLCGFERHKKVSNEILRRGINCS